MPETDQCDHLILLVGSNPLPNAVAARVLTKPRGRVSLIHSRSLGDEDNRVESRLKAWLEKQAFRVDLHQINDESDPSQITDAVNAALKSSDSGNAGLNYTGGTKAMAVHAHQTVRDWAKQRCGNRTVRLSYLNARKLKLVFDPGCGGESIFVGLERISLEDMATLHGRRIDSHQQEARLPESAQGLAAVFALPAVRALWETWLFETLYAVARKWVKDKDQVFRCAPGADVLRGALFPDDWTNKTTLSSLDLSWPVDAELFEFVFTIGKETQTSEGIFNLGQAACNGGFKEPKKFCKWLAGEWLESLVFLALDACRNELGLNYVGMDLNLPDQLGAAQFQFDVAAIRGYQLFACSCTVASERAICKQKLIEAYLRAHQLGGDEARVALICCHDDPKGLEKEIKRDILPEGRVRVFGFRDLPHLPELFREWVEQQS